MLMGCCGQTEAPDTFWHGGTGSQAYRVPMACGVLVCATRRQESPGNERVLAVPSTVLCPSGGSPEGGVVSDVLIKSKELVMCRLQAPRRLVWVGRSRRPLCERLQRLCSTRKRLLGESCTAHEPQCNAGLHAQEIAVLVKPASHTGVSAQ